MASLINFLKSLIVYLFVSTVNAADNKQRDPEMDLIKIDIDP